MTVYLCSVYKYTCFVCSGTKTNHDVFSFPFSRNKYICFVPKITCVFTTIFVCKNIAKTRWHWHRNWCWKTICPICCYPFASWVKLKIPHTV